MLFLSAYGGNQRFVINAYECLRLHLNFKTSIIKLQKNTVMDNSDLIGILNSGLLFCIKNKKNLPQVRIMSNAILTAAFWLLKCVLQLNYNAFMDSRCKI